MEQFDLFTTTHSTERIEHHWHMMRICWPQWEGPRVEDSIHGRCSVHTPIVENLSLQEERYHYMAPCRIESISEDRSTFIAVIDYPADSHMARINGQRLRLGILDLWPPVFDLVALRHAERASA